ncbi:MAG: hypothetical protein HYZ11_17420 [Candidatus Tectomicrobia bacterium]|uniref:Sortilin N-terminal domain-containing protein n=1 Tax=Tectimicrobiota bacterium TaxID=2528274 RepID=A0A932I3G3_UNCTE|nr:hypothetical protein [Candidatus Tectomicrobia bacterium]
MGGLPARRTVHGFTTDPGNAQVMYAAMLQGLFRSADGGRAWVSMSPELKELAAVAVNPKRPEEIFVSTTEGTIYRSGDGGKSWKKQNQARN